ncbi:MAG: hypothetical protein E5X46_12940 [Mesorhizobium sp.]|uniref:hypothetical protein n=1 Tax=Mesorhizobium sp. TaxID=1871066 RepID=UPI0012019217|nr:hypothetical protein [Mesorhizobium sp.]TIQ48407.1 MAG: hypothetical protein E5X47_17600 [Mesorhizobium sp.]TIQ57968.1 MAG: hypothetical protein E5X46_12940 [Mesorhizobium sp.]
MDIKSKLAKMSAALLASRAVANQSAANVKPIRTSLADVPLRRQTPPFKPRPPEPRCSNM